MAIGIKCNRCGVFQKLTDFYVTFDISPIHYIPERNYRRQTIHLCQKCYDNFTNFMKDKNA